MKARKLDFPLLRGHAFVTVELQVLNLPEVVHSNQNLMQPLAIKSEIPKACQAPTINALLNVGTSQNTELLTVSWGFLQ